MRLPYAKKFGCIDIVADLEYLGGYMAAILTASELVVVYGTRTILDSATLGIAENDRIGLVGRNGCGKTTFLKILAGLQGSPDERESRLKARSCRQLSFPGFHA